MDHQFKPEGYNSASPYFVVNGAQKLMDLLIEIFDGVALRKYEGPNGKIMHAEIKIDDSVLMFGDSSDQFPPNRTTMHVYVDEVDKIFQKAIDLGCEPIKKPVRMEGDPDRRGTFKDFAGNMWSVSTQL